MAFSMARKLASKAGKPANEKVQLSLPPATLKRLRIAAAELGQDLSEDVADLIDARFSGVHVRGMNPGASAPAGAGQGGPPPMMPSGPSYVPNTAMNVSDEDDEEHVTEILRPSKPRPSGRG